MNIVIASAVLSMIATSAHVTTPQVELFPEESRPYPLWGIEAYVYYNPAILTPEVVTNLDWPGTAWWQDEPEFSRVIIGGSAAFYEVTEHETLSIVDIHWIGPTGAVMLGGYQPSIGPWIPSRVDYNQFESEPGVLGPSYLACIGDWDGDGFVGVNDLSALLGQFSNGATINHLSELLSHFGDDCQ